MGEDNGIVKQLGMLPKYGLVGVFFALIALAAFMGWMVFKISGNHIDHATEATVRNTQAWNDNTAALTGLKTIIETKIK